MKKFFSFFVNIENKVFAIILLTTMASSIAVYSITSSMFYNAMVEDVRARTKIVNTYARNTVALESFTDLNNKEDFIRSVYGMQQRELNKIRQIANVRYLYTAKKNAEGKIVYLIDGLELGSEDFRFIGDSLEPEMLPTLERCLNGSTVESDDILYTDWGPVFPTCWPFKTPQGNIVGAVVMEFDAEHLAQQKQRLTTYSIAISLAIATLFMIIARISLHKVSEPFYKKLAYTDYLTGLNNRTAFELDLQRHTRQIPGQGPLSIIVYDLNNLKVVNDILGHGAGDAYIKKMAGIIHKAFAQQGVSYRIGGDEFATVVLGQEQSALEGQLHSLFLQSRCTNSLEEYFEFSYGVATYSPLLDKSLHEVLVRADQNMYTFKARNKLTPREGIETGVAR